MNVMVPADILKEIEISSQKSFLPIIGPVKGKYLAEAIVASKVSKILEIGTLVGYSAILMATNLPEYGLVTSIEINPQSASKALENVQRANLTKKIKIIVGDAIAIIPGIRDKFDMIFIDAEKSEYKDYLRLSEPLLKKGAIVFADNVKIFADQMQDYLNYVRTSGKYSSRYIDVGYDGVEVSTKLT